MHNDANADTELRSRIERMRNMFESGKILVDPSVAPKLRQSLMAVRTDSRGEIDLTTVDSTVRSMASLLTYLSDRQELKEKIPINKLQEAYFDHLETNFGTYYREMTSRGLFPNQVAMGLAADPNAVRALAKGLPGFCEWIFGLWENAYDIANWHVEDKPGLNAVFGGDLFPTRPHHLASTCGIYADTLIIPDPFLRTRFIFERWPDERKVHYLVKHSLNLLTYRDLAIAEVDPPLVLVIPDRAHFDDAHMEFINRLADHDTTRHLGKIFGIEFSGQDEVLTFLHRFDTIGDIVSAIQDRARLLFEAGDSRPIPEQFKEYIENWTSPMGIASPRDAIMALSTGRMRQINDLIERSRLLSGTPVIEATTSWRYFQWKIEYSAERAATDNLRDLHTVRALQSAAGQMSWLGAVPNKALIEIRRQNALPELRAMLSEGVSALVEAKPANFFRTSDRVVENIENAFEQHRRRIDSLRGKIWRFAGVELAGCMVHGAIEIASACGIPFVSLINSVIDQTTDLPKMRELPSRYRALANERRDLDRSPCGILFSYTK